MLLKMIQPEWKEHVQEGLVWRLMLFWLRTCLFLQVCCASLESPVFTACTTIHVFLRVHCSLGVFLYFIN